MDRLDLEVPAGSLFGFLGPNGAGKTTTIRLLTGLAWPSSGRAVVAGLDPARGDIELRRRISHQDQQSKLYGWMKGRELLEFVGRLFGFRGPDLRSRVEEVLEKTGLVEAAGRRVAGYSGGMRQRLNLAQALMNRPQVLFLDEPASSLDPAGRHDALDLLADLRGQVTVFMSSHILEDVEKVCDRVGIIDRGRLVADATMAELQARFAEPVFAIELEPGQAAAAADLVRLLEQSALVEGVGRSGPVLRVAVNDAARAGPEILRILASSGVHIARFERLRPSLEDVFLRLVPSQQPHEGSG
ncbi:MAG TPA: ABC transporter ATP-binding protein [Candidatus Dormibacteraeota bacterium]|nr:ABC transporter ATP-binding protein [Candidatus Dormibacteraeota bacterium]